MHKEIIENCTLYHGDCQEILPQIGTYGLILTDPPYGIGEAAGKNKSRGKKAVAKDYGDDQWDNKPPPHWLLLLMIERAKHSIMWGGNYFGLPASSCWLVWDKNNGTSDFADCELAWTNLPKAVRLKKFTWAGMRQENMKQKEERAHPTQKPVQIMEWCLSHVKDVSTVCDPFMGSGTTGVACVRRQLAFTGIEREQKYFDIACRRIEEAYKTRPALFDNVEQVKPEQGKLFC